ncbi:carbohydrate-binding module family 20 domain-containing protein [Actinosynnema mirum]|uniref:Alpha-amylase n=1 Tax=Actinosynnema mirum (strain ATCC 29888 / DSM 43827 / JCM 3225 / NBRC 14064 / NCIMB 13271 / NRRL B-12336 / IMRU 3971 / 101) TaxID=446462 RepID=C6WQ29_ACTMD|nr:carbohydrate-binding module family 20 domain-containing protein [Actinosynnema mirum]ACU35085.1 alpha amylase catalytic region [Actinosynnema mirum DSM 43827]
MAPPARKIALFAAGALIAGVVAAGATQLASTPPTATATPPGAKTVTATLFQWTFDRVATECATTLGPKGYGYVEVSPATEHIQGGTWWTSYQPVSYRIAGRLGSEAQFRNMVSACHNAGVKVIADAVINHMSAGSGTGTGGTRYTKYAYPGHYGDQDFHTCRTDINDYRNRDNVQNCELSGLSDLNTGSEYVRSEIAEYLNNLLSMGVDGFRIDAAKHMPAADLSAIKAKLTKRDAFWVHEVIYGAGEAVQPGEYTGSGDVDEFRYAYDLKRVFTSENLAYLKNFGEGWGHLPSGQARPFVDNWDTERNGSTLSYKDGSNYTLANVFMLAWPYGSPQVYSGYEFSNKDQGPPAPGECYSSGWECQHRWPQIANMVGFRNTTSGTAVTNWWDNGRNAIAFGRGDKGYAVVNRESSAVSRTFQTSLPAGTYCDVQRDGCTATHVVNSAGQFTATVNANEAIALHVGAMGNGSNPGAGAAAFSVNATTVMGQNIFVVGDHASLGGWDPARAVALSSASYPLWKTSVSLPNGTAFAYKYIRKEANGSVTWESGANRTSTSPATLNDTWRN